MKQILLLSIMLLLFGCATAHKMNNLGIGMTKPEVVATLGRPDSTTPRVEDKSERLTYELFDTNDDAFYRISTTYYVNLVSGKVASYGCEKDLDNYSVIIDGITNPNTSRGHIFVILPLNDRVDLSDLEFREYANYLSNAMISKGFRIGNDPSECDVTIFLAYGIGDPKEQEITLNLPTYGQTGISSKRTTGNIYGSSTQYGNTTRGSANYSSTTTYTPSYGVTGYIPHNFKRTTYHRYAYIYANDHRDGVSENDRLRWKLLVESRGSSSDLRKVLPVMIAVAQPYLGQNTQGQIDIDITSDDPRISALKKSPTKHSTLR